MMMKPCSPSRHCPKGFAVVLAIAVFGILSASGYGQKPPSKQPAKDDEPKRKRASSDKKEVRRSRPKRTGKRPPLKSEAAAEKKPGEEDDEKLELPWAEVPPQIRQRLDYQGRIPREPGSVEQEQDEGDEPALGAPPEQGKAAEEEKPSRRRARRPLRSRGEPFLPASADEGEEEESDLTTKLEIPPTVSLVPAEQRTYSFSIEDGSYEQLIAGIARQTGLGVLGDVPKGGKVSFVTDEELTYDELIARAKMLLFKYKPHEPYYLLREDTHLEVLRVADYVRRIPRDRMFRSVEEYLAAELPGHELVLVLYTPKSGSVADLQEVRDMMPDYVRVTPLEGKNTVTIFALASDMDKYLGLIDFFAVSSTDPRTLEVIEVEHILASEAVNRLQQLMDLDGGARRASPKRGASRDQSPLIAVEEPDVSVVPDDAQGVILIRAMEDKIAEIKLLLPFIDVDTEPDYQPVIIPVKHADPVELVGTIEQILSSAASSTAGRGAKKPVKKRRRSKGRRSPAVAGASTGGAGDVKLLTHPSVDAIIVVGDDESMAEVRRLVEFLDVEDGVHNVRIEVQYCAAGELAGTLTEMLGGKTRSKGRKGASPATFSLVADPSGNALWFTGSEEDLATIREMVSVMDNPDEVVSLRIVRLENQSPSFVAGILQQYDSGGTGPAAAGGKARRARGKRKSSPASPAKFTADDAQGRLYLLCTDSEWEEYQPLIKELEAEVSAAEFVLIPVAHIDPAEAIAKVQSLLGAAPGAAELRFETTDDGFLVIGAGPAEIDTIESLLAQFDRPVDTEERVFEIKYGDPGEIASAIQALLGETGPKPTARRPRKRAAKGAAPSPAALAGASSSGSPELTIVEMGRRLFVRTAPDTMERVAELIAEFDVEEGATEIRVYADFPPGADIEGLADTLSSMLSSPQRPRAPRKRGDPGQAAGGASPQFIPQPVAGKLVVIAEPTEFEEIEQLLEVLRHDVTREPVLVEFVDLEHGDPDEVVEAVEPLLELKVRQLKAEGELTDAGAETPSAPPAAKGARRRRPARRTDGGGAYHLSPVAGHSRIVIAGPKVVIDEAKVLIAAFDRPGDGADEIEIAYVDLEFADPVELVEQINPLLQMKVQQLVETGELAEAEEPAAAPKPAGRQRSRAPSAARGGTRYHLEPDERNSRIVIAAAAPIIEEARGLIAEFDQPGDDDGGPIFRTVALHNADPEEMANSIKQLMGGRPARARRVRPGQKQAAVPASSGPAAGTLSIVAAPGGEAVVLQGPTKEVEQAIEWIEQLDSISKTGRIIKVYEIQHADVDKLLDLIMADVDTPAKALPGKKRPPRRAKGGIVEPEEDEEFATTKTRTGTDLFIQADLIDNTLVVSASPAKIARISEIIAMMDTEEEAERFAEKAVPKLIHELEYASPLDAAFALESVLEAFWEPADELPKVDYYTSFGDVLVVKYPDKSRFGEIRELITKFVDVPDPGALRTAKKPVQVPAGISAKMAALWLQMNNPDLDIEVIDETSTEDTTWGVREVTPPNPSVEHPCILPLAFRRATAGLLAVATGQADPEDPDPEPELEETEEETEPPAEEGSDVELESEGQEPPAREAESLEEELTEDPVDAALREAGQALLEELESSDASETPPSVTSAQPERKKPRFGPEKVKIYYDDATGALRVEGKMGVVQEIPEKMEELKEELKELAQPPDIRIYRLRYINVYEAEKIINEMFNATQAQRAQIAAAQRRVQQQRARQMAQQRRQQQQGRDQPGSEQEKDPRQRGRQQPQQQVNVPQLPPTTVRVYPNPRDRTLILRADPNQYPALLKLIATIDQPKPMNSTHRVYQLKKLNAEEVEDLLTDWLGLNQATTRSSPARSRRTARGRATPSPRSAPESQLPQTITQPTVSGELGVDPKDIKITSNPENNTIIALAPEAALDYIGGLIEELEGYEVAEREWKTYELTYADADEVQEYLEDRFGGGGGAASNRKGPRGRQPSPALTASLNTPTFLAYPRLNMLSAQATGEQFEEIEELIAQLDVVSVDEEFQSVTLKYADAQVVADTLAAMFSGATSRPGQRRPGQRAPAGAGVGPTFIGDAGGKLVFFSAPDHLHGRIHEVIEELEEQSQVKTKVRIIELEHARPSDVADAIESAYSGQRSTGHTRGRRRRPTASTGGTAFTVTPSDATKRLFVMADDDLFEEIESLARSLDQPAKLGFDFRVYPLKHASAREMHTMMTTLVTDYMRRLPRGEQPEPFSVEVNDDANALIVLGSPIVFGFVEETLARMDTPENAAVPPGILLVPLENADAQEVAQAISRLWASRSRTDTEEPPKVEANRSLNMVIVRGTQRQIDEIKRDIIDPLEEHEGQALQTEVIALQHARAESVADLITQVFEDLKRAAQGVRTGPMSSGLETAVAVTPDPATNQLIVRASAKNMQMIKERVAELDTADVAQASATSTKVYPSPDADPTAVVNIIKEWTRAKTQGGSRARGQQTSPNDLVVAVAEPWTQTVVVTASEANHSLIKAMLEELGGEGELNKENVHVINLENTEAEAVSRTLNDIFVRSAPRGAKAPSISAVQGSKAVMVRCKDSEFEQIAQLITELDREDVVVGDAITAVTLLYTDATEVQTALQDYLKKPGSGGRMAELVGGTRVSVLVQSNAVIISGKQERVERLEALARDLDQAGEKGSVPQIIKLEHADVGQVLPTLQEMFTEQRGGGRRGQRQTVIASNDALNVLVVRAEPTDMAAIEATVASLDTKEAAAGEMFRLIPVAQGINVTDLAETVELSINASAEKQASRGGGRGRRGQEIPQVTIVPDKRISSLVVTGSTQLFDDVEKLIREYEGVKPPSGVSIRVIQLGKVPGDEIEQMIDQLKGESASATKSKSSSRRRSGSSTSRRSSSGSRRRR